MRQAESIKMTVTSLAFSSLLKEIQKILQSLRQAIFGKERKGQANHYRQS